jgi:hypothetical protein
MIVVIGFQIVALAGLDADKRSEIVDIGEGSGESTAVKILVHHSQLALRQACITRSFSESRIIYRLEAR